MASLDPFAIVARKPVANFSKNEKMSAMKQLGLHHMKTEWADAGAGCGRIFSSTFRQATLKIFKGDEEVTIPMQTCTTVMDVKQMLGNALTVDPDSLTFIYRQGMAWKISLNQEEMPSKVSVKGIQSFKQLAEKWHHPFCIIGAGYRGVKTAIKWQNDGSQNFTIFDRHDRVGGHCWISAANKHSRLQSEFAAFHLCYGPDFKGDKGSGSADMNTWGIWPTRDKVLQHFQKAAEDYGVLAHCVFNVEATNIQISGWKDDPNRAYFTTVRPLTGDAPYDFWCSGILHFPGAMGSQRIWDWPGEDDFTEAGGMIRYGSGDAFWEDVTREALTGSSAAIIGNGASAVENLRTFCEHGVSNVTLIARQDNLHCPRLCSWFVHQASSPVATSHLLDIMEPMYELAGLVRPSRYSSVEDNVISGETRFAIGDFLFLALAWGKADLVIDEVKRFMKSSIYLLNSGRKLTGIKYVIKALGFAGDPEVDRMHGMRNLLGNYADGDPRRIIRIDAHGLHGASFESLAPVMPMHENVYQDKFFLDFPKEWKKLQDHGVQEMLPRRRADEFRPAYHYDIRHAMTTTVVINSMCPKLVQYTSEVKKHKHKSLAKVYPVSEIIEKCKEEWNCFQKEWADAGGSHDFVPYPYSESDVQQWLADLKMNSSELASDDSVLALSGSTQKEDEASYNEAMFDWWTACGSRDAHFCWNVMNKQRKKFITGSAGRTRSAPSGSGGG